MLVEKNNCQNEGRGKLEKYMTNSDNIKRGDLVLVHLTGQGSEQSGIRPAVIIQNNVGNKVSPTTIIVPLTSQKKKEIPTHVELNSNDGVLKPSTALALCEQPCVVDKSRLIKKLGTVSNNKIEEINQKIMFNLGII